MYPGISVSLGQIRYSSQLLWGDHVPSATHSAHIGLMASFLVDPHFDPFCPEGSLMKIASQKASKIAFKLIDVLI
jgi:hypothetical protein